MTGQEPEQRQVRQFITPRARSSPTRLIQINAGPTELTDYTCALSRSPSERLAMSFQPYARTEIAPVRRTRPRTVAQVVSSAPAPGLGAVVAIGAGGAIWALLVLAINALL